MEELTLDFGIDIEGIDLNRRSDLEDYIRFRDQDDGVLLPIEEEQEEQPLLNPFSSNFFVNEKETLEISVFDLLDPPFNDEDSFFSRLGLSLELNTSATTGMLSQNDNSIEYSPGESFQFLSSNYTAPDSFSYRITVGNQEQFTGTALITVVGENDPVTANDDHATTNNITPVFIDVLANDVDVDFFDVLTIAGFDTEQTQGNVSLGIFNGNLTAFYDPGDAFLSLGEGESATDVFSYTVSDGNGSTDTATVTVEITGVSPQVTNTSDRGAGSLRQAIDIANRLPGLNTITFAEDLFSDGAPVVITLENGELTITDSLIIEVPDENQLVIDANNNSRIFNIDDGDPDNFIDVTLRGLTLTGGNTTESGGALLNLENLTIENSIITDNQSIVNAGGIQNEGTLTLDNSVISNNTAMEGHGGGIHNFFADLNITNTHITGNAALGTVTRTGSGGGILNDGGEVVIESSTISDNRSTRFSGGIGNDRGSLTLSNSTVSGNHSRNFGGVLTYMGNTDVSNSTITNNSSELNRGNGLQNGVNSTTTVTSSIVAGNPGSGDLSQGGGSFISGGHNLIGDGNNVSSFTDGVNGDIVGTASNRVDPLLGELSDNGGLTPTHLLLAGSPAIDAGSNPNNLEFDQRGEGFSRVLGDAIDIGATETMISGQEDEIILEDSEMFLFDPGIIFLDPTMFPLDPVDLEPEPTDRDTFDPGLFPSPTTFLGETVSESAVQTPLPTDDTGEISIIPEDFTGFM